MDKINKLNNVKSLLVVGAGSALVSAALWAWMWHTQGVSIFNLRAEHGAALFFYLVSLAALTLFIGRLRGRHLAVAAVALTLANAPLLIITWLISQYYREFFVLTHPFPIQAYDPRYVHNWRIFFLEPFLLLLQFGLLIVWLSSLACLILRKVRPGPERQSLSPTP
jgi:hypothetical protein